LSGMTKNFPEIYKINQVSILSTMKAFALISF